MMKADIEDLYYKCIDRIDNDLEVAEDYLIGCVTFLHRQEHGRADRDRISEDFSLSRGLEKYVESLTIISRLSDSSLATLIASSLDLSKVVNDLLELAEKTKGAIYDEVQAHAQTSKIKKAIQLLNELSKIMRNNVQKRVTYLA